MDTFIDTTEGELNRRLRSKDMVKRATATADGQYLTLPTDWLEAINIEITSGDFTPLFQQSIESLDVYRKANDNSTGQPAFFAIVDNTISSDKGFKVHRDGIGFKYVQDPDRNYIEFIDQKS